MFLTGWETDCSQEGGKLFLQGLEMEIMPEEDCHKRTFGGYYNQWDHTLTEKKVYCSEYGVCTSNHTLGGCVVRVSYSLSEETKIKDHVMCATNTKTGLGDTTCIGDTGGPLTVRQANGTHVLVGIAADGYACGVVSFDQNPEKCGKHFL